MSYILVFVIHFLFSVGLFLITNWIGKHSYSVGYMEISIFVKSETAPAFNFLFRVLSPVIYIIIISTILYQLELDVLVINIYLVSVYYIVFRVIFNLVTNRARLLNWRRQAIHALTIVIIAWLTYDSIIKDKRNILPDFSTVSNELWIIILLFIFHTLNNLQFSSEDTEKRKANYLKTRFEKFEKNYNILINDITTNKKIQALVYAIMIYEDFNRPKIARIAENIKFRMTKKPMTLGVMQVRTDELIDDKTSVIMGVKKIVSDLQDILNSEEISGMDNDKYRDWFILSKLVTKFNGGRSYNDEVTDLFRIIWERFYSGKKSEILFGDN